MVHNMMMGGDNRQIKFTSTPCHGQKQLRPGNGFGADIARDEEILRSFIIVRLG